MGDVAVEHSEALSASKARGRRSCGIAHGGRRRSRWAAARAGRRSPRARRPPARDRQRGDGSPAPLARPGALRKPLGPNGVAIFAGAHHVGVISQRLKSDDYIYYDSDVVPAVAWILP
jgi:hypothetical protein